MKIFVSSSAECAELALRTLGVNEISDLFSTEGLAASLRRAASFLCPATPRQLIDAVLEVLHPLQPGGGLTREDLSDLLDRLVSSGDLLELRRSEGAGRLLYLGPPSYIERQPGQYLLLGIRPFGAPLIGSDLARAIRYEGHTRMIELPSDHAEEQLSELDLHIIRREQWIRRPRNMPPGELIRLVEERLSTTGPPGAVEGLTVIDHAAKATYYRGRWRPLEPTDSGLFVARRPQAYGADLWCVVLATNGAQVQLLDLPADDPSVPGHDEAWRVQAAIDYLQGNPQVFRVSAATGTGTSVGRTVDFFSPLPTWAERYLQLTGKAVSRTAGALCSYRVAEGAIPSLISFLENMMWMRRIDGGRNDG